MDQLEHDSAASLEVRFEEGRNTRNPRQNYQPGWYVFRNCSCHRNEHATVRFDTQEEAKRALGVLDEDARRYSIRV